MEEIKKMLEGTKASIEKVGSTVEVIEQNQKTLDTRIADLEVRMNPRFGKIPGLEEEAKNFSFFRAVKAIITNDWSNAGFEREVFAETRKRAMSVGEDTSMGYFVPGEILAGYIELLRAELVVAKLGATVLSDLKGVPIQIPKLTGGPSGYWVTENTAPTESTLTTGQVNLSPKKVGALVKLSNELLKWSNPSVEGIIREQLFMEIAETIDKAALRGSGDNFEPCGIANVSGINTVTIGENGGAPTFDLLYDMQYALQEDNAYRGNLGYVFHPAIRRRLIKQKVAQYSGDTGGDYIITPMVSDQQLLNWMNHPYQMTTHLPINLTKGDSTNCAEIFFGNWKDMLIGFWGGVELMASKETSTAFQTDQTWIRIFQEVDVQVRHAESFCLINDATIA